MGGLTRSNHAPFRRDVVGIMRAIDEAADGERLQHFAVALALFRCRQDMAGHLGLDRGCALGFGKLRRGILKDCPHQRDQIKKFGVDTIEMQHFAGGARPAVSGPVYLSIDLDGIDPAFAPGVSHREPGGLSVRDVLTMIQSLEGPIVGADVVEFNPAQDLGGVTASVAAKIVREIAGGILLQS